MRERNGREWMIGEGTDEMECKRNVKRGKWIKMWIKKGDGEKMVMWERRRRERR